MTVAVSAVFANGHLTGEGHGMTGDIMLDTSLSVLCSSAVKIIGRSLSGACCEKGPARTAEIGHSQLERIIAGLADIAPDFADLSWSSPSGISMPGPD